jgi:hypothetical protein
MGINGLRELGGVAGLFTDECHAVAGDRLGDAVSGKEPGLQLTQLLVAPQEGEQVGG